MRRSLTLFDVDAGGDLDGDGYVDPSLGGVHVRKHCLTPSSTAVVYAGGPAGLDTAPTWDLAPLGPAALRIVSDLTGDGTADLAASDLCARDATIGDVCRVVLLPGTPTGPGELSPLVTSNAENTGFAVDFELGEVNGDTLPDLVIGREAAGLAYRGTEAGWSGCGDRSYDGLVALPGAGPPTPEAWLGRVRMLGDLDGDGTDDFALTGDGVNVYLGVPTEASCQPTGGGHRKGAFGCPARSARSASVAGLCGPRTRWPLRVSRHRVRPHLGLPGRERHPGVLDRGLRVRPHEVVLEGFVAVGEGRALGGVGEFVQLRDRRPRGVQVERLRARRAEPGLDLAGDDGGQTVDRVVRPRRVVAGDLVRGDGDPAERRPERHPGAEARQAQPSRVAGRGDEDNGRSGSSSAASTRPSSCTGRRGSVTKLRAKVVAACTEHTPAPSVAAGATRASNVPAGGRIRTWRRGAMLFLLTGCVESEPESAVRGVVEPLPLLREVTTGLAPPRAAVALPTDLVRQLRVTPLEVDLGLLDPGERATATITLRNGGPHGIQIFGINVSSIELEVASGGRGELRPGETTTIDVDWTAGQVSPLEASLSFVAEDDQGRTAQWEVPFHGRVIEGPRGELVAAVAEVAPVGLGCEQVTPVDVVNTGLPPLELTDLVVAGRSDTWRLTLLGGGEAPFPIEIPNGGSIPFALHFVPVVEGEETASVSATLGGAGGAIEPIEVSGLGYADQEVVDEFTAGAAQAATGLLAVNDEAVDELRTVLPDLFEALAGSALPWRLALVTGNDGTIEGDVPYVDDSWEVGAAADAASGMLEGADGDNDLLLETLEVAVAANAGWLLEAEGAWDASRLHLVAFNADQEQSTGSVAGYVDAYRAAKPDSAGVRVHAFAGTPPKGCTSGEDWAAPSDALYEAVELTDGLFWDWCQPWDEGVAALAASITASTPGTYSLSSTPDPSRLHVFVDGEEVVEGWTVELATRELRFDDATTPPDGASIRVEYWTALECHDGA